jgi:hypothetical protein
LADWEQNGPAAIERVRERSPAVYLRIVASLVPKEFTFGGDSNELEELTDEELKARLLAVFEEVQSHFPLLAMAKQSTGSRGLDASALRARWVKLTEKTGLHGITGSAAQYAHGLYLRLSRSFGGSTRTRVR